MIAISSLYIQSFLPNDISDDSYMTYKIPLFLIMKNYGRLVLVSFLAALFLYGCAAVQPIVTATQVAGFVLEAAGLKKADNANVPDSQKAPRNITLQFYAGTNLNTDAAGKPLALVVRIYKLKQDAAFNQATYDTFMNPAKEKEAMGADLLEVKEITLIPGQRYESKEKISREAEFVGAVALFRAPAAKRWKVSFQTKESEESGITVGLHACALTVGSGKLSTSSTEAYKTLSDVRCQES